MCRPTPAYVLSCVGMIGKKRQPSYAIIIKDCVSVKSIRNWYSYHPIGRGINDCYTNDRVINTCVDPHPLML